MPDSKEKSFLPFMTQRQRPPHSLLHPGSMQGRSQNAAEIAPFQLRCPIVANLSGVCPIVLMCWAL